MFRTWLCLQQGSIEGRFVIGASTCIWHALRSRCRLSSSRPPTERDGLHAHTHLPLYCPHMRRWVIEESPSFDALRGRLLASLLDISARRTFRRSSTLLPALGIILMCRGVGMVLGRMRAQVRRCSSSLRRRADTFHRGENMQTRHRMEHVQSRVPHSILLYQTRLCIET